VDFSSVKDKHSGTCYIVGKGPSLTSFDFSKLDPEAPIIAINESIQVVEKWHCPNPVYSLQQDGKPECMVRPQGATLLLSGQSSSWMLDYSPRLVYNQVIDLGVQDRIISAVSAIEFARHFGCDKIVFIAFDAITSGTYGYYDSQLHVDPANSLRRFQRYGEIIKLSLRGLPCDFIHPDGNTTAYKSAPYTVITLTGDRHLPFELCRQWILRQTVLPSQWIVVDDGHNPLKWREYAGAHYVRRHPHPKDPEHTIKVNMLEALKHVRYDNIVIMEDDDWYDPAHCEGMLELLSWGHKLVGQRGAYYYYWPLSRIIDLDSETHAALFKTAFHRDLLPEVQEICETTEGPLIDIPLWKNEEVSKLLIPRHPPMAIGMKGLTGRSGTTSGWNSGRRGYTLDAENQKLISLIGDDVKAYKERFPLMEKAVKRSKNQLDYEVEEDHRYSWLYKDGPYKKTHCATPRISKFTDWAKQITDLENQSIVDLGCGRAELATLLPHKKYMGVDISTYVVEKNTKEFQGQDDIEFIRHSIDRLPFEDMSFDTAICCDVMEHVPENRVDRVLKEIFRVASAAMLTIDCAKARIKGPDGKNLHCTIKPLAWWKKKIQRLAIIRYEDYQDNKVTFYCGSGYKSQGTFPERIYGQRLRRNSDGSVWLARAHPKAEKYMDKHYVRVPGYLRWHYPIADPQSIKQLKDLYKGKKCYIIGKGPSLDKLGTVDIEKGCPVIALNEAVHKAEECDVKDLYVMQQDTGINCRPKYATPLLHFYLRHLYPEIRERYIFNDTDFGLKKHGLTVIAAIAAAQYMGCTELSLIAFDACITKQTSYAKCIGHQPVRTSSGGQERFLTHRSRIEAQARDTPISWVLP
jgi:SAM-dependent methyltransferase